MLTRGKWGVRENGTCCRWIPAGYCRHRWAQGKSAWLHDARPDVLSQLRYRQSSLAPACKSHVDTLWHHPQMSAQHNSALQRHLGQLWKNLPTSCKDFVKTYISTAVLPLAPAQTHLNLSWVCTVWCCALQRQALGHSKRTDGEYSCSWQQSAPPVHKNFISLPESPTQITTACYFNRKRYGGPMKKAFCIIKPWACHC